MLTIQIFFCKHNDIKTLFSTVNEELKKLEVWFTVSRLSLNIKKTKYTFFHKNSVEENTPLKLPDLHISNRSIERKFSTKLLGVLLNEAIAWNDHIYMSQKKSLQKISALYPF